MANQYKNKVVYNGTTLIDLSDTTAVQSDVASGKYFYTASGQRVQGTGQGGSSGYTRTVIAPQQTVTPNSDRQATLSGVTVGFVDASHYIVTLDGVEWYGTCEALWGTNLTVGEAQWFWSTPGSYVYPFGAIYMSDEGLTVAFADTNQHTIKVEKIELTGSSGGGGSATLITKNITANGTYSAEDDDADGYSSVTVNVPSQASVTMNVQTEQSTSRRNNTALGSVASLTCSTAGTYDVYWSCARSNTSQTWGSQLYINGTAYDTENTTWSNNVQNNHLTGVVLSANDTVAVYGRSRSGYYIYAQQLTIIQTA